MKTFLATIAATAVLTGSAFATVYPGYADMNRDGIVTAGEYEAYAFDRADEDGDHFIGPNEQPRYDRLMDLDQEF